MTEEEWEGGTDTRAMLEFLRGRASDRKARLFACGCCRLEWGGALAGQADRAAVAVAEKFADGAATRKELKSARRAAWDRWNQRGSLAAWHAADLWAWQGAFCAAHDLTAAGPAVQGAGHVGLLRDIFANPFRPVTFAPELRTATVIALAAAMYESRAFDRMPVLADALEEAGCNNVDVLSHCRGDGPHLRGCWVVDLVLGRE